MSVAEFRMHLKSESSPTLLFQRGEQKRTLMNRFKQGHAAFRPFEKEGQGGFARRPGGHR